MRTEDKESLHLCWAGTRRTRPVPYQGVTTGVSVVTDETEHGGERHPPRSRSGTCTRVFRVAACRRRCFFTAHPGQVLGFIGPNGAGKTTTMRIRATLDLPTPGGCLICGESVIDKPDGCGGFRGFHAGLVRPLPEHEHLRYLDFFARAYGLREHRDEKRLNGSRFHRAGRPGQQPDRYALQGHVARCVWVARYPRPSVILDEPAAGLDPGARVELRELIRLLASKLQKPVLISSHILTELGRSVTAW
ncbi:MAG: hypothetical protein Ct9H300mP1_13900 [Planctomycetaceae bacterium]|nr:MAG: hypothetical protein Ct9H300mP1_13900 [Planctomycetaceae bacterium]